MVYLGSTDLLRWLTHDWAFKRLAPDWMNIWKDLPPWSIDAWGFVSVWPILG